MAKVSSSHPHADYFRVIYNYIDIGHRMIGENLIFNINEYKNKKCDFNIIMNIFCLPKIDKNGSEYKNHGHCF